MSVLRKIFGPSRKEIWRQLSEQIGARFVEGGAFNSDRVEATHGEWIVTLDELCRIGSAYEGAPGVRLWKAQAQGEREKGKGENEDVAGSWKREAGSENWKLETGNWHLETDLCIAETSSSR